MYANFLELISHDDNFTLDWSRADFPQILKCPFLQRISATAEFTQVSLQDLMVVMRGGRFWSCLKDDNLVLQPEK